PGRTDPGSPPGGRATSNDTAYRFAWVNPLRNRLGMRNNDPGGVAIRFPAAGREGVRGGGRLWLSAGPRKLRADDLSGRPRGRGGREFGGTNLQDILTAARAVVKHGLGAGE